MILEKMKTIPILLAAALIATALPASALACAPAPSCWMKSSPAYLKSICRQYVGITIKPDFLEFEEPINLPAFAAACKRLGITVHYERN